MVIGSRPLMDSVSLSRLKSQTLLITQMIPLDRISPLFCEIFNNYILAHSNGQNKTTSVLLSRVFHSICFVVFWVVFTIASRT